MAATIRDVALAARVSNMTVSRVFSPRAGAPIAPATRERVLRAARELGYRPNTAARALASGRSHHVLLHIPELSAYHTEIVRVVHAQLSGAGYQLTLRIDDRRGGLPDLAPASFPADGILTVDMPGQVREVSAGIEAAGVPVVQMGTDAAAERDCVLVDLHAGVLEAVRHLVAAGARRIAYVVPEFADLPADPRRAAYEEALREADLPPLVFPISWPTRAVARRETAPLFTGSERPDAIFCYSDDCAVGVFAQLRDRGLAPPDDLLLCGCDGIADSEYLAVPLTTVAQPIEEMCARAWALLQRRMEDPGAAPLHETLRPHLLQRRSTARRGEPLKDRLP